jgi:hypothetical protein
MEIRKTPLQGNGGGLEELRQDREKDIRIEMMDGKQ